MSPTFDLNKTAGFQAKGEPKNRTRFRSSNLSEQRNDRNHLLPRSSERALRLKVPFKRFAVKIRRNQASHGLRSADGHASGQHDPDSWSCLPVLLAPVREGTVSRRLRCDAVLRGCGHCVLQIGSVAENAVDSGSGLDRRNPARSSRP